MRKNETSGTKIGVRYDEGVKSHSCRSLYSQVFSLIF